MGKIFATYVNLFLNIFLFFIKLVAGFLTNSIAIFSDAFNSFTDIITSFVVNYSVKLSGKRADKNHPFGHNRAEPLAALFIFVLIAVLALEIFRSSVIRLFDVEEIRYSAVGLYLMIGAIAIKLFLTIYLKISGRNSPALKAASMDSRNDVLVSFLAILGFWIGNPIIDASVGIIIAGFILISGYFMARKNIDYLMGKAPDDNYLKKIRDLALSVKGVKNVHGLKVHYVGTYFHVEIHIVVDGNMKTNESHEISDKVQNKIQSLEEIQRVFVHIDTE